MASLPSTPQTVNFSALLVKMSSDAVRVAYKKKRVVLFYFSTFFLFTFFSFGFQFIVSMGLFAIKQFRLETVKCFVQTIWNFASFLFVIAPKNTQTNKSGDVFFSFKDLWTLFTNRRIKKKFNVLRRPREKKGIIEINDGQIY